MNQCEVRKRAVAMPLELKGARVRRGALDLHAHALAPVPELPVLEVVSAAHFLADLTFGSGQGHP
jgi:acetoacetate decarboxylase